MEKVIIEFDCQITRILPDGFNAVLKNGYVIKFRDKINIPFKANDLIKISLENVNIVGDDLIKEDITIYVVVSSFITNGFLFKDVKESAGFFWRSTRGMLTYKMFETSDIFMKDTIIKIYISKIWALPE